MSEKAKFCYCLNTYTISKCGDKPGCDGEKYEHWEQGIGDIGGRQKIKFDNTFDETFN
tara:strand:- start:1387 stop:1560 length:174 start_codon:yes stop_codon:yes gene_type:complete